MSKNFKFSIFNWANELVNILRASINRLEIETSLKLRCLLKLMNRSFLTSKIRTWGILNKTFLGNFFPLCNSLELLSAFDYDDDRQIAAWCKSDVAWNLLYMTVVLRIHSPIQKLKSVGKKKKVEKLSRLVKTPWCLIHQLEVKAVNCFHFSPLAREILDVFGA